MNNESIPKSGYNAAKEFTNNMEQFGFNRGIGGQKSAFLAGYMACLKDSTVSAEPVGPKMRCTKPHTNHKRGTKCPECERKSVSSELAKKKDNGFKQGYACALACIIQGHGCDTPVEEAYKAGLPPLEKLKGIIDEHDYQILSKYF